MTEKKLRKVIKHVIKEEKSKYQKFFAKTLKDKYDAKSPSELSKKEKKEFFKYIEKNWTGEKED